jgi:hypothetical protein
MTDDEYRDDLRVRVAVLEERSEAHAKELEHWRSVLEQSNAMQTQNYAEVKERVETLEKIVDELRLHTAAQREMSKVLDGIAVQIRTMNENIASMQIDAAKQKGFVAAVFFIGSAVWGVFATFKDEILRWFK